MHFAWELQLDSQCVHHGVLRLVGAHAGSDIVNEGLKLQIISTGASVLILLFGFGLHKPTGDQKSSGFFDISPAIW